MGEDIINLIADLLDNEKYIYTNNRFEEFKIRTYYDEDSIKHIKVDLGYETYTISVD